MRSRLMFPAAFFLILDFFKQEFINLRLQKLNYKLMLQRIQTIFLSVAFIISLGIYVWPIAIFPAESNDLIFTVRGFLSDSGEVITLLYPFLILSGIISFLILYQLFSFKKRIRQIQTGKAIIILLVIWYGVGVTHVYNYFQNFEILLTIKPHITLFIPFVLVILILFANKYIRKDEELVRSVDRIR